MDMRYRMCGSLCFSSLAKHRLSELNGPLLQLIYYVGSHTVSSIPKTLKLDLLIDG